MNEYIICFYIQQTVASKIKKFRIYDFTSVLCTDWIKQDNLDNIIFKEFDCLESYNNKADFMNKSDILQMGIKTFELDLASSIKFDKNLIKRFFPELLL